VIDARFDAPGLSDLLDTWSVSDGQRRTDDEVDTTAMLVLGPRQCRLWRALGIPARDWLRMSRCLDHPADAASREAFGVYLDVLVAQRCAWPGDDLVSGLVAHDAGGRGLTADEIRRVLMDFVERVAAQSIR
jgi:hypothetical protein